MTEKESGSPDGDDTSETHQTFLSSFLTAREGTLDFHTLTNRINWGKNAVPLGLKRLLARLICSAFNLYPPSGMALGND